MKKQILSFVALAALTFSACNPDNAVEPNIETEMLTVSEDNSNTEAYAQSIEDEAAFAEMTASMTSTCPTVTFSARRGTFPQTVTLDYGTAGCADRNGRIRKGKIIVTYSDTLSRTNATKTVTFDAFSIDSVGVSGTRVWRNTGLNAQNQPTFSRTATNMRLSFTDGTSSTWSATHTVVKTAGIATITPLDDAYQVSGSETGTNRRGTTATCTITTPIVHRGNCPYPVSGVRSITVSNNTRSLDFSHGGGDCDRTALLTKPDGTTRVIILRR